MSGRTVRNTRKWPSGPPSGPPGAGSRSPGRRLCVLPVEDFGTFSVEFKIDDTEPRRVPLHILGPE